MFPCEKTTLVIGTLISLMKDDIYVIVTFVAVWIDVVSLAVLGEWNNDSPAQKILINLLLT